MTWSTLPAADHDLPPLYFSASLPQCPNLPRYSESPDSSELRVLHSESSGSSNVSTSARTRRCSYQTDYLDVDLGEFPSMVMHPVYGFNGLVEGEITFRKKCSYVTQLTVKVSSIPAEWHSISDDY